MSDAWNNFVEERGTADEVAELRVNAQLTEPVVDADFAETRRARFFAEGDNG